MISLLRSSLDVHLLAQSQAPRRWLEIEMLKRNHKLAYFSQPFKQH